MSVLPHEHCNQGGMNHCQSNQGMSHCFARSCLANEIDVFSFFNDDHDEQEALKQE